MENVEWQKDNFLVSTDKRKLQVERIHDFLKTAYWSKGIPIDIVQNAIDHSHCFGLYRSDYQIGFARMISDEAIFAYLADVYVIQKYRGRGLGKWLVSCVMEQYGSKNLRRIILGTRNMHRLYEQFGFKPIARPGMLMEINHVDLYLTQR